MTAENRLACIKLVFQNVASEERSDIAQTLGVITRKNMAKEPTDDFYTKYITTLAISNPIVYIRPQPIEAVNFISGMCGIPLDSIYSDRGISFQISTFCEQIRKMYLPKYIGQASFMQNLNVFSLTNIRLVLNITGSSIPGGKYNVICNWLSQQAGTPLTCPLGDIVVAFDNEQIVGKTWSIKPDNKIAVSIIMNIAAIPVSSQTELQNRIDLHPRKWLNFTEAYNQADTLLEMSADPNNEPFEVAHYEQLYVFVDAALDDVIKQQSEKQGDWKDKYDDIINSWMFNRLYRICPNT